ncbi:MAG: nuclear transport factor 2 family protein [Candidatus Sulfotelmatobacter sp.]
MVLFAGQDYAGAVLAGRVKRFRSAAKGEMNHDSAKAFSFLSNCRLKMNDQQEKERCSGVRDQQIRAALDQHWAASDANDFETEHLIYHEDAVLDYPQSGERTRGRRNIQGQRASQPSKKRFTVRRIIGGGDLWVTEFILTYDGKPSYTVSIMEFRDDKVARETQYFADPFVAPAWRAQWVERMDT